MTDTDEGANEAAAECLRRMSDVSKMKWSGLVCSVAMVTFAL
jgi:hypothetical protein